jgi:hypothetical protein
MCGKRVAGGWQGAEGVEAVASVASGRKRGKRVEAGGAENQPVQHPPLFEGQEAGVWNSQVGE